MLDGRDSERARIGALLEGARAGRSRALHAFADPPRRGDDVHLWLLAAG